MRQDVKALYLLERNEAILYAQHTDEYVFFYYYYFVLCQQLQRQNKNFIGNVVAAH